MFSSIWYKTNVSTDFAYKLLKLHTQKLRKYSSFFFKKWSVMLTYTWKKRHKQRLLVNMNKIAARMKYKHNEQPFLSKKSACKVGRSRGGPRIFSGGGGGDFQKNFEKFDDLFLGRSYWFSELSQSTKETLFWQNVLRRRQNFAF